MLKDSEIGEDLLFLQKSIQSSNSSNNNKNNGNYYIYIYSVCNISFQIEQ